MNLKSCPFCGQPVHLDYEYGSYVIHQASKKDCRHGRIFMRAEEWNNRPIEDTLRQRIKELELEIESIKQEQTCTTN